MLNDANHRLELVIKHDFYYSYIAIVLTVFENMRFSV